MPSISDSGEWRTIEVAPRYVRRNAARTMGGSIVRALVELITNSRDSAFRMLSRGEISAAEIGARPIEIEYAPVPSDKRIVVRDHFEGMAAAAMRGRLLRYGASASDFESGAFVRGINARGAKDVAVLGRVKFESIHGDRYSECEIHNGRVRGPIERSCTAADRDRTGLTAGNGTAVTLFPDDGISLPNFDALCRDLERHIELRYVPLGQPQVPIRVTEVRARGVGAERAIVGFRPEGELILETTIALPDFARYSADPAKLKLYRSAEPLAPLASRSTVNRLWKSEAGIIVTDGRTAQDLTFFFARGSDDPAARYLFGELYLPQITGLLTEFEHLEARRDAGDDVTPNSLNPSQVTDPDRMGLNRDAPFIAAVEERVRPIVEQVLRKLQDELSPSAEERVGQQLRSALERLGTRLAEKLETDVGGGVHGEKPIRWGLSVVPGALRVTIGSARRVTVYLRREPEDASSASCSVRAESDAVAVSASEVPLSPVDGRPGVMRGAFDVLGEALTDGVTITLSAEGLSTAFLVSVREPDGPIPLDKDLQFSHRSYSAQPGRRKRIEILADPSLSERDVSVALLGGEVSLTAAHVRLDYDPDREIAVGQVFAECLSPATDHIVVRCGELTDEATITFRELGAQPRIDFRFTDEESYGTRRFVWDQGGTRVLIAGGHPTISRVLGPRRAGADGEGWPGQTHPQTLAILAELIADAFVYRKLQQAIPRLAEEDGDYVDYENLRYQFFDEVYLMCHEALTPPYEPSP